MRIGMYLNTTVTIVRVSLSSGDRAESLVTNVPAAVFQRDMLIETVTGKATVSKTFVAFKNDVTIGGQDEIIIDGVRRPIVDITQVRMSRFSSAIDHIEVEVD